MSDYEVTRGGVMMPRSKKPEFREVATTGDGRDITQPFLSPLRIHAPNDDVLRIQGGDYTVYKTLLRDNEVAACFSQRRLAVVSCEWQVDAGGDKPEDEAAAEFLREQINGIGFDRITDRMLYGIFYGYAAAEILWARDGKHIVIDEIKVRDRRRFGFDGEGRLRLKTQANYHGELLPDRKFWAFSTGADHDDEHYGLGLAHWLYWPVFFKRSGIQFWLTFLERFGQPTTVGKHPTNATDAERNKLLNALEAIATDTGITIPQGMEIEFLEAARSGTGDYSKLCEYMDKAIAKLILGQTASMQGTPGRLGSDDLQGDVRADLVRADADLVCESFNKSVVKWLIEYNFPSAALPRVYRVTDPADDMDKRAERDKRICEMGFKPTVEYINQTYGGQWVERTVQPASTHAAVASFSEAQIPAPNQLLEQARTNLEPATNAWIEQIRALAKSATSLSELQDLLLAEYPKLTLDEYAAAMATATSTAHFAGRNDVAEEQN
ncbi:MAG: DUF935 domain-containing protein [Cellvibrio sp.]